ncbi:hypothetical protein K402DRAFT_452140 [Aulographum hederae CBS 113979]|uniref:VPS9 domain-containing protein n=1 Tax=Aulographum hederae CBS 113979 TaxID=1176131 RepID=A0A6G1H8N0_9PEZI|nr:hypothetical protein K402DRAFT_452140 [Aulographum hederae CBS 113979]
MHPLNPFLRAFFRSPLPAQCLPVQHYILLVPTTDVLLTTRDRETGATYADLASSEEFLASHVVRAPSSVVAPGLEKGASSFRDNRGKAKQYTTLNGRTVIIKDNFLYSNKGFKTLNQAQLLSDVIYHPDTFDAVPWLVYYISKPLTGSPEPIRIIPAVLGGPKSNGRTCANTAKGVAESSSEGVKKKDIKSFSDLLNSFPMIARQMQPGLERLFREFSAELEKPLPALPPAPMEGTLKRRASISSTNSLSASFHSSLSNGTGGPFVQLELGEEEDAMRRALETGVTAAIDLFQMVDKQQLSHLGATTDLTGPVVERMIERYVAEQVHDSSLFPRICSIRRPDDSDLESRIRQMGDIDISQVGLPIINGRHGKQELAIRLGKAVDCFKKMGVASSPQEMMDVLLETQKVITLPDSTGLPAPLSRNEDMPASSEKKEAPLTINADTLVSLLLVVVIRSSVRHLQARLSYMRHFIFIDDVESGEIGYALSTFEAVLSYLARDSAGLKRSSRQNRRLWQATSTGDVSEMRAILEPDSHESHDTFYPENSRPSSSLSFRPASRQSNDDGRSLGGDTLAAQSDAGVSAGLGMISSANDASLAHVFPFQRPPTPPPEVVRPPIKKRVSMDVRSMSTSSSRSFLSRTDTIESRGSATDADISIETLCKTQTSTGESVLMMAVETRQEQALRYLLGLTQYYTIDDVLEDCTVEGTTLLSAAVQTGNAAVADVFLEYLLDPDNHQQCIADYFTRQDNKGRTVGHYLFNQPQLIPKIGCYIPWRLKDKNGQTPLFALCRSYDHEEYVWMVDAALSAATDAQEDGQILHVDDHIDNKGNTLLHIVNDAQTTARLLYKCDTEVNASNDKHFTPLMVASKYGRGDLVRTLFADPRVDLFARDLRGLTAVELAKDDEVRNRIDDLVLLGTPAAADGRTTTVVRSFFVEDGTVRFIVKSGAPNANSTVTVTTCRRNLSDFELLAKWLALELPASWIPSIANLPTPYLIPSKPSRAILRDIQLKLDNFLRTLLTHSTFSTHEMVWEFFLVPEVDAQLLAARSKMKADIRAEMVREEYAPILDVREVELFVSHAKESVRSVHHATRSVLRRVNKLRNAHSDLSDAAALASNAVGTLDFLPRSHSTALSRYVRCLTQSEFNPLTQFHYSNLSLSTAMTAILDALNRPATLIASMQTAQKSIDRHRGSLRRNDRWPLGLLDETRGRLQREAADKERRCEEELRELGRELRYTQERVAGELAAWQEGRGKAVKGVLREFAKRMVVVERARLEGLGRAIRGAGVVVGKEGLGGRQGGKAKAK